MLAEGSLGGFVFGLALFAFFEECLVFFVDHGRGVFETCPDVVAEFFCHGADLAPFVVELLQAAECCDYVFVVGERGGVVDEEEFLFEVFLEVVVAQLFVNFQVVGVAFASFLEAFPHRCFFGGGHFAKGVEGGLEVDVLLECAVYVVGVLGQGDNLLDYGVFLLEVFTAGFLHFGGAGVFLVADSGDGFVEGGFFCVGCHYEVLGGVAFFGPFCAVGFDFDLTDCSELLAKTGDFVTIYFVGVFFQEGFRTLEQRCFCCGSFVGLLFFDGFGHFGLGLCFGVDVSFSGMRFLLGRSLGESLLLGCLCGFIGGEFGHFHNDR